jgi:hypothetical protein
MQLKATTTSEENSFSSDSTKKKHACVSNVARGQPNLSAGLWVKSWSRISKSFEVKLAEREGCLRE